MTGLKLGADATRISDLLSPGRFYRIPAYQRSYSWQESDALDLLHDLLDAVVQERSHFLGAIVRIETGTPNLYEIVDGQQRLTTLTLIIAILRDLSKDKDEKNRLHSLITEPGKSGSWRLTLNHVDAPYLRSLITQNTLMFWKTVPKPTSESHELLRGNFSALSQELSDTSPETRSKLASLLFEDCPVIDVQVANRDEGYKVFQVLNSRGRQPNGHDILKTELFERARLSIEEADRLARSWTNHEARLGAKDFDDLLRQIRLLHDPSPRGDLVSGFCRSVLANMDAKHFLEKELPRYVDAFAEIKSGNISFSRPMPDVDMHLGLLRTLEHTGWRAPGLKFLVSHDRDADTAREFFCDLERLGFAMQLIVSDRDARPKRYRKVCDEISSDAALFSKSGALSLTREERQKLAQRLTGRFGSVSQRRALCIKLNALMDGGEALSLDADATVEHILPKNVAEDSGWMTGWPDLAERRELTDTIGNFCLLTKKDNQKADRLEFLEKRDAFFLPGDKGGQFAITREVQGYNDWTPDIVKARTKSLVGLLIKAWKLDLPDG